MSDNPVVQTPIEDVSSMDLPSVLKCLWEVDENRLEHGTEYQLDLNGAKDEVVDDGKRHLFRFVNARPLLFKPTYKAFIDLLDKYKREQTHAQTLDEVEHQDIKDFIELILDTKPMRLCHEYLVANGFASENIEEFKNVFYKLWFQGYSSNCNGIIDSCGFEHIFVGEEKDQSGKVTGFHNWIQLYREENKGHLDYRGFYEHEGTKTSANGHVLSVKFVLDNPEDETHGVKPKSTFLIGVSPEFEFALYTLLSLVRDDEHIVFEGEKRIVAAQFEDLDVKVDLVVWNINGDCRIRTAFPQEAHVRQFIMSA